MNCSWPTIIGFDHLIRILFVILFWPKLSAGSARLTTAVSAFPSCRNLGSLQLWLSQGRNISKVLFAQDQAYSSENQILSHLSSRAVCVIYRNSWTKAPGRSRIGNSEGLNKLLMQHNGMFLSIGWQFRENRMIGLLDNSDKWIIFICFSSRG